MKKLLFITTGGTIACDGTLENGFLPVKAGNSLLSGIESLCEPHILDLYSIDSTDITPSHFVKLYRAFSERISLYDGAVILHGTDTMAYTGAFLGLTVTADKPVILTGSMLPDGAPDSDAQDNILFAVKTALDGKHVGVWLAFCNRIIRGEDIVKVSACEKDAFRSYSGYRTDLKYLPPEKPEKLKNFPAVLKLSPFTKASDIRNAVTDCGMVIETYGAGGIHAGDISDAIQYAAIRTRVIVSTPCMGGTDLERYDVGRRALNAGALSAGKMSTECAAVYLWLTQ